MEPVKLIERAASGAAHAASGAAHAASGAAHAVRHPIASAAYAAGIMRGVAEVAKHAAQGGGPRSGRKPISGLRAVPTQPVAEREPTPPAPQREPAPPHESFATEPKATSRTSEHGGPGNDAEIDEWMAEAADEPDIDIETPVGTTGADVGFNPDTAEADLQQPGTEPLLDPGTAKAIRSESEMMRKDAERDPE